MSTIASLSEAPIAPSLGREGQRQAVTVTAALTDGCALGDAFAEAVTIARPLQPDSPGIPMAEAKTIGDSKNGPIITFGFALVVILLVLAPQFESVRSAIIVLSTVPFGLARAVFAMLFTGVTLNVYIQIGVSLAAVATPYLTSVAGVLLARFSKPKAEEEARLQRELAAADAIEGKSGGAVPAE